jgi:conjugal transfer/type IV secretion protein DotA/TraY
LLIAKSGVSIVLNAILKGKIMNDLLGAIGSTDIAFSWIEVLFKNEPGKPLSAAFAVFTASLAFLGALFMAWHVLIGIVNSAYTGKVLGERWHQIWAPLRVVMGFGLLVPIGGGFSAVHFLLKDVIGVVAVNLGNKPIVAYIESATDRSNANTLKTTYGGTLITELLAREICANVVSVMNTQTVGRGVSRKPRAYLAPEEGKNVNWTNSDVHTWDYGACGAVTLSKVDPGDSELFKAVTDQIDDFNKKRLEATTAMVKELRKGEFYNYTEIAKLVAINGGWNPEATQRSDFIDSLVARELLSRSIITDLKAISDKWNDDVTGAAQEVFKSSSTANAAKLKQRILDYGFMVAGSYERSLSAISGMAVGLAGSTAVLDAIKLTGKYDVEVRKALSLVDTLRADNTGQALGAGMSEPVESTDWIPWLISKVFPENLSNMKLKKGSADPVGDMMTFGHSLLNTASIAIAGMVAAAFVAGTPSAVTQGPLAAFGMAASWVSWIIVTFIIVGFLYAFVLPVLPMIMVFIMGVSWLILFLEAAIAGVLWAFAFIRMDGQEFFDKNQAPGVTLIFNLLMRPALGMLAYCGMLLLQPTLLNSLSLIWQESFAAQSGNMSIFGFVWLWQFVAGLVIFSYMQWQLALRLTGLIPTIPDRVGHWMGMQMHGYNDSSETGNMVAVVAALGTKAAQTPIGTAAGDVMKHKERQADLARQQQRQIQAGKTEENGGADAKGKEPPKGK